MNPTILNPQLFVLPEPENCLSKLSGSNLKQFLVIYSNEDQNEEHLLLLKKILAAVKFDMDTDILLLELSPKDHSSFSTIKSKNEIKHTLILGMPPQQLGLQFDLQQYQPTQHMGCTFLSADTLAAISNDKSLKGMLWNALKQMFLGETK